MRKIIALVLALAMSGILPVEFARAASVARIKDIASLQAGRDNQLIGYGLVVGLQGSGDSLRASPFTEQSLRARISVSRPRAARAGRRTSPPSW